MGHLDSSRVRPHHGAPRLLDAGRHLGAAVTRHRPVDEERVEVIQPEELQCLANRGLHLIGGVISVPQCSGTS
jgi:hypothetical protein